MRALSSRVRETEQVRASEDPSQSSWAALTSAGHHGQQAEGLMTPGAFSRPLADYIHSFVVGKKPPVASDCRLRPISNTSAGEAADLHGAQFWPLVSHWSVATLLRTFMLLLAMMASKLEQATVGSEVSSSGRWNQHIAIKPHSSH